MCEIVYIYIFLHVCVYAYMCVCVSVYMCICMCVYTYECLYISTRVCVCFCLMTVGVPAVQLLRPAHGDAFLNCLSCPSDRPFL